ncbi:hypothetical protein LEP1GSC123_2712 [Leptospira borgpetersenii str. 200701203]|uniref:Uncharacterized protein n=1 Tax=Leptospira borgpetersenii str. 200701203 TaxID=1193007 RepID=M3H4X3_LEPBO|nr:hypothetical protein LEP1GSC123_2712 [Leptospira borgpetersenii str. 200701203]
MKESEYKSYFPVRLPKAKREETAQEPYSKTRKKKNDVNLKIWISGLILTAHLNLTSEIQKQEQSRYYKNEIYDSFSKSLSQSQKYDRKNFRNLILNPSKIIHYSPQ